MKTLNERQLAFCNEYVANGYNGSKAYHDAYKQENLDTCKSEAYRMVRLPHIQEGIKNAELDYRIEGHGLDINKKAILIVIKRALDAKKTTKDGDIEEDYTAQLKAIEVYAKLTGDFSAEKKTITINDDEGTVDIDKLTPEEREEYKAKILAEL